ncbi:MAG: hypothetical protein MH137_05525 [Flavobacteriales bacterium]|nr:hypothetical protein [Flavobacteriales bacterium]
MKIVHSFLLVFFTGLSAFATQEPISAAANSTITESVSVFPDTLVDLNRQFGGLKSVVVAKEVVIPEAIEITPSGLIILTSDELLKAEAYSFEVKAEASDNEVYIISVRIKKSNGKILVSTVADKIDMASGFRAEGKIYVVVAVSMILFFVIIGYLFVLDRRMNRIQSEIKNRK